MSEFLKKAWPFAAILLVFIVRFLHLTTNDVAMDEPFTLFFAQGDLTFIFGMLPGENNPPLFFLLLHFWIDLFGISPLSVRFLPALFSALTAIMLFVMGRRFFSISTGITAAAIFLFSDFHQLFAHEARVYSLFALLTVVSMYLFMSVPSSTSRRNVILLLIVTNILLVYSHFFGFFILFIQLISTAFIPLFRRQILKTIIIAHSVTLLGFVPYLPILLQRFSNTTASGTWVEPVVFTDLYTMLWRYLNAPVVTVVAISILGLSLFLYFSKIRKGGMIPDTSKTVLLIWFLVLYFLMFLISFKLPIFLDRYTVFISVGFYMLLAVAITSITSNLYIRTALQVVFIGMMAVTFHPHVNNKRDLKEAVDYIASYKTGETVVILTPSWLEYGFSYHYDPEIFGNYRYLRSDLNNDGIFPAGRLTDLDTLKILNAGEVIWFEEWYSLTDPQGTIPAFLNRHFISGETVTFPESFKVHHLKSLKSNSIGFFCTKSNNVILRISK